MCLVSNVLYLIYLSIKIYDTINIFYCEINNIIKKYIIQHDNCETFNVIYDDDNDYGQFCDIENVYYNFDCFL